MTTGKIIALAILCLALCAIDAAGQPSGAQTPAAGGGGGQAKGAAPASAGASSSLQGLSWPSASWDTDLTVLPTGSISKTVVACYTLTYGNSGGQPFVLKPAVTKAERDPFDIACKVDGTGKLAETDPGIANRCKASKEQMLAGHAAGISKGDSFVGVKWSPPCATLSSNHPMKMDQTLVIGIDVNGVKLSRVKILNLNVTYVQGSAINPTPITASFSNAGSASTTSLAQGPYFLTWPNQVPGDTVATINVNAVYTPPVPGEPWQPATAYPVGSVVVAPQADGHYYTARVGGVSAADATNTPAFQTGSVAQTPDGSVDWVDSGNTAPSGGGGTSGGGGAQPSGNTTALWAPGISYNRGQVVLDPYNGHYFTNLGGSHTCTPAGGTPIACGSSGLAPTDPFSLPTMEDGTVQWADRGTNLPAGATAALRNPATTYNNLDWVNGGNTHFYQAVQTTPGTPKLGPFIFPISPRPKVVTDGTVVWQDAGSNPIAGAGTWTSFHQYAQNYAVMSSNGDYYYATTASGTTGPVPAQPYFGLTPTFSTTTEADSPAPAGTVNGTATKMTIVWQDSGTTAPASIAAGPQPDSTVSLLNLQFAQSHSLSYYNLDSGVVFSWMRSPTFAFSCTTASPAVCTPVRTSNSRIVDPVLLFTVYPKPWDAEAHCPGLLCLFHLKTNPPGFNFGLSLANPATSFYGGGSFELFRNVQLVAGYNFAKEPVLSPTQPSPATATSTAATIQKFSYEPFFGITLNVPGLIQQLFSGGGGSKGAAAVP